MEGGTPVIVLNLIRDGLDVEEDVSNTRKQRRSQN